MAVNRETYALRAVLAHQAMQRRFRRRGGMYRYDEGPALLRRTAQLWPFSQALMATLDVAGIGADLPAGLEINRAIAEHLQMLERYWDASGPRAAYCSDVRGLRWGDRYYDDNAWVGLALIQLERLRPGAAGLERASELFRFAVHGWDEHAGGVFWVEQGRGTGAENHDRNLVSTAPNAELGLHLRELGSLGEAPGVGPEEMYGWILTTLDASQGTGEPGTGLFWDKVRGDGAIDRTIWTYNQGSMIGANVLLARRASDPGIYLARAEAIARKALSQFGGTLEGQPASFNAIFFRNLLLLHAASADQALRQKIVSALAAYAEAAWLEARDRRHLFHLNGKPTLLDQSAMVQVLALLAWEPELYSRLA